MCGDFVCMRVCWMTFRVHRGHKSRPPNNYLDAVVALLVDDGDVAPAHAQHDLHHRFDLMVVGWNGARKILEALLVAQLRTGGEKRDLWTERDQRWQSFV